MIINDLKLKAIVKCRKYPSILAIKEKWRKLKYFYFSHVTFGKFFKNTKA